MLPLLLACASKPDTAPVSAGQEVWVLLVWTDDEPDIDAGWLVSFSVELLACQEEATFSLMPTAHAGHGLSDGEALRQLRAPRAESLTDRTQSQFGHLMPAEGEYCELFYLVSFTTGVYDNRGLPDNLDMLNGKMSLFVQQDDRSFTATSGYGVKRTIVDDDGHPAPLTIHKGDNSALLRLIRDASVINSILTDTEADATNLLAALAESTVVVREH